MKIGNHCRGLLYYAQRRNQGLAVVVVVVEFVEAVKAALVFGNC